jgi:hypothetical protein
MRVRDARAIAQQWVRENAEPLPDFRGAFLSGSILYLPLDGDVSPASDVDLFIVLAGSTVPLKPGKLIFHGLLLEVTYIAFSDLADPESVARNYHLAHCFAHEAVICDPTSHLSTLHRTISPGFNQMNATRARCQNALDKIERGLASIDPAVPWHDQVMSWMFPTSITTHVVLVAARRNPTVRLRYLAARKVLQQNDGDDWYQQLLDLLGCGSATQNQVQSHLDALSAMFDLAAAVESKDFFFSSDIAPAARPIAIDGSQSLIDAGHHREAVFWMIATFARCMKILNCRSDDRFEAAAEELLGLKSPSDLYCRSKAVLAFLPALRTWVDAIVLSDKFNEIWSP